MKTLVGITAYGGLPFLKLTLDANKATITKPNTHVAVVVAKPNDVDMLAYLRERGDVIIIENSWNKGFSGSMNDLYDFAFVNGDFDALIIQGNDVIPYPKAIDALIECAETTDQEWVCSMQYDSKTLVREYPEVKKWFAGPNLVFSDFSARPFDVLLNRVAEIKPEIGENSKCDVRNLCLFKRSVFDSIGYADANFWPNAYFEDCDYCRRGDLAILKGCAVKHSVYFHWWSRTIHQGAKRDNDRFFRQNESYYETKWGGLVGREKYAVPFNGGEVPLADGLIATPALKISSRANESAAIAFWSSDAARC